MPSHTIVIGAKPSGKTYVTVKKLLNSKKKGLIFDLSSELEDNRYFNEMYSDFDEHVYASFHPNNFDIDGLTEYEFTGVRKITPQMVSKKNILYDEWVKIIFECTEKFKNGNVLVEGTSMIFSSDDLNKYLNLCNRNNINGYFHYGILRHFDEIDLTKFNFIRFHDSKRAYSYEDYDFRDERINKLIRNRVNKMGQDRFIINLKKMTIRNIQKD